MTTPTTTPIKPVNSPPDWDPIRVRDLVRTAQADGRHPALLELGQEETASFRVFLANAYGEEGALTLRDTYYLGLEVVQVEATSHLAVTGNKLSRNGLGDLPPLWSDRSGRAA